MPATETPEQTADEWAAEFIGNVRNRLTLKHRSELAALRARADQAERYETILRDVLDKLDSRPDPCGVFDRDRQEIRAALADNP